MLLKNAEAHWRAEEMALEAARLYYEESFGPFPYEGCRWLRRGFDFNLENLIPLLDLWLSDIAGYSSRGKRLLTLSHDEVVKIRGVMSLSFFDKHPEYASLKPHINASNTPDLVETLALYERMRTTLLFLFDFMIQEECRAVSS